MREHEFHHQAALPGRRTVKLYRRHFLHLAAGAAVLPFEPPNVGYGSFASL
jgi:hypothetical protein